MTTEEVVEFRTEDVCCAKGCGKLGTKQVGGKVWLVDDEGCRRQPVQFVTGLVACDEHQKAMPSTIQQFLGAEWREHFTRLARSAGRQPPNYNSAQWDFLPIAKPAAREAN